MSFNNLKITQNDKDTLGVVNAPDVLEGDARENKLVFDRLTSFVADKHNDLCDTLEVEKETVYTKSQADIVIDEKIDTATQDSMMKAVYDTDGDGKVDSAQIADEATNAQAIQNLGLFDGQVGIMHILNEGEALQAGEKIVISKIDEETQEIENYNMYASAYNGSPFFGFDKGLKAPSVVVSSPQCIETFGEMYIKSTYGSSFVNNNTSGYLRVRASKFEIQSDMRLKKDIESLPQEKAAEFIYALKPKSFVMIDDEENTTRYGFIAQDVLQAIQQTQLKTNNGIVTEFENITKEGEMNYSMDYQELISPMVGAIKQLNERVLELENMLKENQK